MFLWKENDEIATETAIKLSKTASIPFRNETYHIIGTVAVLINFQAWNDILLVFK